MIGYKGFSKDLTCKGFQFAEGEIFETIERMYICRNGFHFCDVPINVLNYYNSPEDVYAIIEALGEILYKDDKFVTNKIKIVKVISKKELLDLCGNNIFKVDSGEYHFKNGRLHSYNDKPAKILENGDQIWYSNGNYHRNNDKPAIIRKNGNQIWYLYGLLHRENDKPAIICTNGTQEWYNNGKLYHEMS